MLDFKNPNYWRCTFFICIFCVDAKDVINYKGKNILGANLKET